MLRVSKSEYLIEHLQQLVSKKRGFVTLLWSRVVNTLFTYIVWQRGIFTCSPWLWVFCPLSFCNSCPNKSSCGDGRFTFYGWGQFPRPRSPKITFSFLFKAIDVFKLHKNFLEQLWLRKEKESLLGTVSTITESFERN